MSQKKEITISRSLIAAIVKSIVVAIIGLYAIQHFGEISGGGAVYSPEGKYAYTDWAEFENPINGEKYYEDYDPTYGVLKGRQITYWMKVKDFYIPSLFGNVLHIVVGALIVSFFFFIRKRYSIKIQ